MKTKVVNTGYFGLLTEHIERMKIYATSGRIFVKQELNGVVVIVSPSSNVESIFRDLKRAMSGLVLGHVGPHPKRVLSTKKLFNDFRIKAENEARRTEESTREKAVQDQKEHEFFAELSTCPAMDRDEAKWQEGIRAQKEDEYGLDIYACAENSARLMQKKMLEGKKLQDMADDCMIKGNTRGISGIMQGYALSILVNCWKHGEELSTCYKKVK